MVIRCLPDYAYPRRCEMPRKSKAWRWRGADRAVLAALARLLPQGASDDPAGDTGHAAGWHRRLVRWHWTYPAKGGRPPVDPQVAALIERMARENPGWGLPADPRRAARPGHPGECLHRAAGPEATAGRTRRPSSPRSWDA